VNTQHVGHGSNPLAITSRVGFRHVKLKGKHVARTENNSFAESSELSTSNRLRILPNRRRFMASNVRTDCDSC